MLQSLYPSDHTFHQVGIDFLGPFPLSMAKHHRIIIAVDHLTRYAETCVVTNLTVADGAPQVIGHHKRSLYTVCHETC